MTGFHNFEPSVAGKWLEVLKEAAPEISRVAFLYVPEVAANIALMHAAEAASGPLGVKIIAAPARTRPTSSRCSRGSRPRQIVVSLSRQVRSPVRDAT